ncbi:hypothetical protein KO317_02305 [Candidatus Micrarchaeota archaeon]|jgi:uncharacterized protein YukE|nr:hypothetical protein [Candidatus Micrarchaeota archaeon]
MEKAKLKNKINRIMRIGLVGLTLATSTLADPFPKKEPLKEITFTQEEENILSTQYLKDYEFYMNNNKPMTAIFLIFNTMELNLNIKDGKEKIKSALSKLEEEKEYLNAATMGLEFNEYLDTEEEINENTNRAAENYKQFAEYLMHIGSKAYNGKPGRGMITSEEYLERAKKLFEETGNSQGIEDCNEILESLKEAK